MVIFAQIFRKIVQYLLKSGFFKYRTWQLIHFLRNRYSRLAPPLEVKTTYDDNIVIKALLSDHVESQLFWQGYQEADYGMGLLIKKNLNQESVFIDVGANIGAFTLLAANISRNGQVHAFEPSKYHFNRLKNNVELNHFKNITLNMCGLYNESKEETLFLPKSTGEMNNSGAATLYSDPDISSSLETESIHLIKFDDYVEEKKLHRIDAIKIDIEGAELNALQGAYESIAKYKPLVLMEIDLNNLKRAGITADKIIIFWEKVNYKCYLIDSSGGIVPILNDSQLKIHQNILCRPEESI